MRKLIKYVIWIIEKYIGKTGFFLNIQICKLASVSTNCNNLEAKIYAKFWATTIKHNADWDYNKHELSGEISYAKTIRTVKIKPQNQRFPVSHAPTSKLGNTIFDISWFEHIEYLKMC